MRQDKFSKQNIILYVCGAVLVAWIALLIAPYMGDWEGVERPRDYDMFGYFLEYGHEMGLKVFGSLNIFAGGHNFFDRCNANGNPFL